MDSELMPCPQCEAVRKIELVTYEDRITMKDLVISFPAHSYRCLECHEEFDSSETLDRNLESARRIFKRQKEKKMTENLENQFVFPSASLDGLEKDLLGFKAAGIPKYTLKQVVKEAMFLYIDEIWGEESEHDIEDTD